MNKIKVKASAKINLSLDVVGKKSNGYHLIESIFQSVGIYDIITIEKTTERHITLTCNQPDIPCDSSNIAWMAAKLFMEKNQINSGVKINIEKNIPSQAGLGGGSADGAGVLYALNQIFQSSMDISELVKIGEKISADTSFFLYGGTAFVQGIGEIINSIRLLPPIELVIAKGQSGISTPEAYQLIDKLKNPSNTKTQKILKAIDKGKFLNHCEYCSNIFEKITNSEDVFHIKKAMIEHGALTSLMSGSGSAVFGIFNNSITAENCAEYLKTLYPFSVHCQTIPQSITIENS